MESSKLYRKLQESHEAETHIGHVAEALLRTILVKAHPPGPTESIKTSGT